jgi:hypothetical protein
LAIAFCFAIEGFPSSYLAIIPKKETKGKPRIKKIKQAVFVDYL